SKRPGRNKAGSRISGRFVGMPSANVSDEKVHNIITTLSEKLFANTVIEEYSYKVLDDEKENA
ncbi:phosphoribosylformylglycinamidine synthase subunit PurS, partial [Staphylococcus aureus]|nr:phosphoribosylformylglycinamidine synthase subunit PurS [Staphylococcus aureus]